MAGFVFILSGFSQVSLFFSAPPIGVLFTDSSGVVWSKFKSSVVVKMTRGAGRERTQNTLALCQQMSQERCAWWEAGKKKREQCQWS